MKLGYLGPQGTFSHFAAIEYGKRHPELEIVPEPAPTFSDLFEGLSANTFDQIIVPVENSVEGTVTSNVDLMLRHEKTVIFEELVLDISLNLMAIKGTKKEDITQILSHPQPLMQCHNYLRTQFPKAQLISVDSTAKAAEMIQSKTNQAAIGSGVLTLFYNLEIISQKIQDYPNNRTRFDIISKTAPKPSGSDKTTLVFTIEKERPGGLYKTLESFAKRNINLTRIFSRPSKTNLGEYMFYIDFLGHQNDNEVKEALEEVKKQASFFRLLGSYRRDDTC